MNLGKKWKEAFDVFHEVRQGRRWKGQPVKTNSKEGNKREGGAFNVLIRAKRKKGRERRRAPLGIRGEGGWVLPS